MRILFLIDWHLYYSIQLANALADTNSILLITRDHNYEISSADCQISLDNFLDKTLDKRIIREKLRYQQSSLKNLFELSRIYLRIRKFRPDIIHIQETSDWRHLLLAKVLGFEKTIFTVHDVVIHPGDTYGFSIKSFAPALINKILRKKARVIIVHGSFLRRQLISTLRKSKNMVSIIPHGCLTIFKNWDREIINEDENAILFLGRISKYKGIDILIKAQPLITEEIPGAKIIIAGKGREKNFATYENLIKDKNSFEIHYRFIANNEVPKFFRRASVVVLPYIEASQSGVVQIAYAFGKPVVVTDVGSIPEVVDQGKTGFVVPTHNPEALANAVIEILKNRELREIMKKNIQEKATTELSWTTIAKKTAEVYALVQSYDRPKN